MGKYSQWLDDPSRFRVTGQGEFPVDMLRYDRAWPASTADAYGILETGQRTIAVVCETRRHVTPARWKSFGWTVTGLEDLPSH